MKHNNVYQLRPKTEQLEQIHILITDRILALVLHYGLEHFLETCQDLKTPQYGYKSKALSIDQALPRHLKNLIRTYGSGEVASLIRVLYSKQLSKLNTTTKKVS